MGQSLRRSTATETLVREHWRSVFSVCVAHARTIPDAEDAAQETFARAIAHLDTLRDPMKVRSWLFGIARRVCVDQGRKLRSSQQLKDEAAATPRVEDPRIDELRVALGRLPAPYREAVTLYYLDGQSVTDLAVSMDLTHAAARQRLARARIMLHQLMTENQP